MTISFERLVEPLRQPGAASDASDADDTDSLKERWAVTLKRLDDDDVGFTLDNTGIVTELGYGGLVEKWNAVASKTEVVRLGDRVTARVFGAQGLELLCKSR